MKRFLCTICQQLRRARRVPESGTCDWHLMTVTHNGITITDHTDTQTEEELRDECAYRAAQLEPPRQRAPRYERQAEEHKTNEGANTNRRW